MRPLAVFVLAAGLMPAVLCGIPARAAGSDFERLFAEHGAQALTYHFCSAGYDEAWADNCRSTDSQSWLTFRSDGTVKGVLFEEEVSGTWTARRASLTVDAGELSASYTVLGPYLAEPLGNSGEYETFRLAVQRLH